MTVGSNETMQDAYDVRLKVLAILGETALPVVVAVAYWWDSLLEILDGLLRSYSGGAHVGAWLIVGILLPVSIWYAVSGFIVQCRAKSNRSVFVHAVAVIAGEVVALLCLFSLSAIPYTGLAAKTSVVVGLLLLFLMPFIGVAGDVLNSKPLSNVFVPGITLDR